MLMLVIACAFWGMGFSWAKNVGACLNTSAGLATGAALGPILGLAIRFSIAAALWLGLAPGSRRGWTFGTVWRGGVLGFFLAVGVIVQHLGLDRASEATTAFLTSLTIVIVPLMMAILGRQWPTAPLAMAVGVALVGIWLLTGAAAGFGRGEWLGVACAGVFSIELILIDRLMPGDSPWRITGMMFLTTAGLCIGAAAVAGDVRQVSVTRLMQEKFLVELSLLTLLTTVAAFGLMNRYQPCVSPTRAALIYLMEPLFAAAFAWAHNGRTMSGRMMWGAALIVLANGIAELKWPLFRYDRPENASD